ncbi:MAG: TraB/GumN family protein [Acidobacteriota bacterium]
MNQFYRYLIAISGVVAALTYVVGARTTAPAETNGILYKITGHGLTKPSYLFGTVHVICKQDMFSEDKLGGYLDRTDRLVMEIDLDDMGEIADMAKGLSLPDGKTLKTILTPEQYAKVDEMVTKALGFSADRVQTFSPVALQVMILSSPKMLGCTSPSAYEILLTKLAGTKKKPIEGLETAAFQRGVVDKLPVEAQAKTLYEMALDPMKSVNEFKQLIAVYKLQDSEKLYDTIGAQLGTNTDMESQLVGARNKAWVPKIEAMIREKPTFIAVGGGHLGGKNGLVASLRSLGYKVGAIKL